MNFEEFDKLNIEENNRVCWREYETQLGYLTNEIGESDFMCPNCPKIFSKKCHKRIETPTNKKIMAKKNLFRWAK